MTAKIINGKEIAEKIVNETKLKAQKLNIKPSLAVILAGCDPASEIYVRNKVKKANSSGFNSVLRKLPENVTREELFSVIDELNNDRNVNGILLQLPLPSHLDEKEFLDKIDPLKDVDGFNSYNAGKLFKGEIPYAIPCTPLGIIKLLKYSNIEIEGKTAVVIGRSNIVGKPMAALLLSENATVIQAHSKTKNLSEITKTADILISATGKPEFIKKEMIKENAVLIDVGIIRKENGGLTGDIDFNDVMEKASYITPVPGGVGPVTIAVLMENTLNLCLIQNKEYQA